MTEPRTTGTKQCARCGRELHVLAFAARADKPDGLQRECRECNQEYQHARYVRTHRPHGYRLGST